MQKEFQESLNKLIDDEKNISYFCTLIKDTLATDIPATKNIIQQVYDFASKNELSIVKGWMCYYLGLIYYEESKIDDSIECLNTAIMEVGKTYDDFALANIYNAISFIYSKAGQHVLANEYSMISIGYAKELKDHTILNVALLNLAINNVESGAYKSAREILEYIDMKNTYEELPMRGKHNYLGVYAEIEIHDGNLDAAKNYLNEIEHNLAVRRDDECESDYYTIKSKLYSAMGNYEQAGIYIDKAYNLALKRKNVVLETGMLIEKAKMCFKKLDNENALKYINKAINRAEEFYLNRNLLAAYAILEDYYRIIEDVDNILYYVEKKRNVLNKLNSYRSNKLKIRADLNQESNNEMNLYELLFDKTDALSSIGDKIISILDVNSLFFTINEEITKLMNADFFGITMYDNDEKKLILKARVLNGKYINVIKGEDNKNHFSSYCIKNQEIILINNFIKEHKKFVDKIELEGRGVTKAMSGVFVPLIVGGKALGTMIIQSLKEGAYSSTDVSVLKVLSNYVAVALKNAYEYKRIENMATYDSGTGFFTKKAIMKEGFKIHNKFKKECERYSLIMLDMDKFKDINDKFGHVVGDKIIKIVADEIKKQIRNSDCVGRYGGDEFLLICPKVCKEDAVKLAERIKRAIDNVDYRVNNEKLFVSVSVGVYEVENEKEFMDCINVVDEYMYKAKNGKENKVVCS